MNLLHIAGGLGLIVITLGIGVHEFTRPGDSNDATRLERMALYGLLIGLPWAAVLFTGFFQLGSTMEPPRQVIAKFIATVAGGVGAFGVLILRGAGLLNRQFLSGILFGSLVLFGLAGYWGFWG